MLNACAATGAGFLTAVLWFDLMFDVQTRRYGGDVLPERVLASIAAYYRRVTTEATPMNRLISLVMLATLAVLLAEVVTGDTPRLISAASLAFAAGAIGLAAARTVRNAVRLGGAQDPPALQTQLARAIYRDHLNCLTAMVAVVVLQIGGIGVRV
ncbi:MAG TPA: hypothetical protein VL379_15040 [Pseudomonadales bacterium]|nr:hypothetical protein [Pseudomonadales bacterium]